MEHVKRFRKLHGSEMARLLPEEYAASPRHPIVLMLHNIRSMWNVGSMFRTADSAGIDRMILSGYTATPPRKEISKTALGADESVPWSYTDNALATIRQLQAEGVKVCALEIAEGSRAYSSLSMADFPICLLVGNEVDGLDDELLQACDEVLEIAQYGTKHSLNVAVAAGIALFELVRVLRA